MIVTRLLAFGWNSFGRSAIAAGFAGFILIGGAAAQTATPADAAKAEPAEAKKKPSKAELGEMLKKCSEEADAKGLTVQKGKSEARNTYRRACMLKNGVAPRRK